ncbi:MAG: response regulator transcription factor [Rubrivivax sp.]
MSSIRVFVVAQQTVMRLGLAAMLAADGGFALAGDAADGAAAVKASAALQPDLMLIDPHLPDMAAADLVQGAAAAHAALGFAVLTDDASDDAQSGMPLAASIAPGVAAAPIAVGRIVAVSRNVAVEALARTLRRLHGSSLRPCADDGGANSAELRDEPQREGLDGIGGPMLMVLDADGAQLDDSEPIRVTGAETLQPITAQAIAQAFRNPLTQREHELLALMGLGLSNHQIAERLSIAMPTVKFHVTHILRKLGADNRTEAVLLALRHGLVQLR